MLLSRMEWIRYTALCIHWCKSTCLWCLCIFCHENWINTSYGTKSSCPTKKYHITKMGTYGSSHRSKITNYLLENLNQNSMEVNFWTDSQIVLKWMNSKKTLKPFVSNRIKEIKTQVETQTWRYVPTDSNPADLQTRGISAKAFLGNKLWMTGPL